MLVGNDVVRDYLERGVALDYTALEKRVGTLSSKTEATSYVVSDTGFYAIMNEMYPATGGPKRVARVRNTMLKWLENGNFSPAALGHDQAVIRRAVLSFPGGSESERTLIAAGIAGGKVISPASRELIETIARFSFPVPTREELQGAMYGKALADHRKEYARLNAQFLNRAAAYKAAINDIDEDDIPGPDDQIFRIQLEILETASEEKRAALRIEESIHVKAWKRAQNLRETLVNDPFLAELVVTRKRGRDERDICDTLLARNAFADSLIAPRYSKEFIAEYRREQKRRRQDVFQIGPFPDAAGLRALPEDVGLPAGTYASFGRYL